MFSNIDERTQKGGIFIFLFINVQVVPEEKVK
jgi:hypothetical protein